MNVPHFWKVANLSLPIMTCALVVMVNVACDAPTEAEETGTIAEEDEAMALKITSPAFLEGEPIPTKYTGEGPDVSPPLRWTDPGIATKAYALICDDPDAPVGTWVHWVIYNIPPEARELPEAVPVKEELPDGIRQGVNDFGNTGYGGPMPPPGKPHRYFFKLYALDTVVELPAQIAKKDLEKAMKGHILTEAKLMGTYQRM